MADSVKIKIEGDSSQYLKTLKGLGNATATAVKGMSAAMGGIAAVWTAAGAAGVKYNAQVEQLKTSFEVMTGSATKAVEITERLRALGASTPFDFQGLAGTVQMLMQYNLGTEEAIAATEMIGDISQGNADKMSRIAMAYGQMTSAGKVQLQDVKQMLEAGFNPLLEISERTGESMESLYDRISKGTLAVSEISGAMVSATSEGGRFYQSMEKQSQTLNGQLSTLKDNLESLGGSVFADVSDELREGILPGANDLLARMQQAFDVGGLDGLMDEFTRTVPQLTQAAETAIQAVMARVSAKLPKYVRNIVAAIPSLIRTASGLAPQLAETFFDIASTAVLDLVSRMPEWGPPLLEGVGRLALNVAEGLLSILSGALHGITDIVTRDADEIWESLADQQKVAELSAMVTGNVDVQPAKTAIEEAYEELNKALHSDLLSDPQVIAVTDLIGEDYDAIYAKLLSFGLSEGDAGTIAGKVTAASNTIMAEIDKLDIGVDPGTVTRWILQAEGSSIRLESAMKRAGLSDPQQEAVAQVFRDMTDNLNGKMPDVIGEVYATLTDGKAENDDRESLVDLLNSAFEEDINAVDAWAEEQIGKLDTSSINYAQDVEKVRKEAALYKGEITTLHTQMVGLVDSLAGQPTAVVEKRMEEFAAIEARLAEINAYISETSTSVDEAYSQAFSRVRAGATTDEADIMNALDYAYSQFKVDTQAIEDNARAAKAEADAAWESGLKSEEDRTAHLETLAQIEQDKASQLQELENRYSVQVSELIAGVREAFATVEPEMMAQVADLGKKLNIIDQLNKYLETMQLGDDSAVANVKEQAAQIIADLTGEEIFPSEINYGRLEDFVTELENSVKEDLSSFEVSVEEGSNPIAQIFQGMFDSAAFADLDVDTSTMSGQIAAIMNGVGDDAAAGIGAGAIAHDFSGETDAMAGNFESSARSSFESHSPARKMIPVGQDVAAGVGQGAAEYDFSGHASTMAANIQGTIGNMLSTAGRTAGKQFAGGLATGINAGRSTVIQAAINIAKAAIQAANETLEINSPSKATMRSGRSFGEGFSIGIEESMKNAVNTAKRMTGQLVTAADISRDMRVSVPAMQVDMQHALENSTQPVNLYVNGRQLGKVMAADNQQAQNSYNRSIALGVGK